MKKANTNTIKVDGLSQKLRVFGSLPRLKIMMCLGKGPKNVGQLIKNCGLSQSAVSQHLTKLKVAGVLKCNCKGRERIYELKNQKAAEISSYLYDLIKI